MRHAATASPAHPGRACWTVLLPLLAALFLLAGCGETEGPATACTTDCDATPSPLCDGNVLVTRVPLGLCENGRCVYSNTTTTCAGGCQDGACLAPPCEGEGCELCEGVTCNAPPAPSCEGTRVAIRFSPAGTCTAGNCSYRESRIECTPNEVCDAGSCIRDVACAAQDCSRVPAPTCEGDVRVSVESPGFCADSICQFEETRTDCRLDDQRCRDGACEADPCIGVSCATPPADQCNGGVATRYSQDGACSEVGRCEYATTTQDCNAEGLVCDNGTCRPGNACDQLDCTVPGPGRCEGTIAFAPVGPGICEDEACRFSENSTDCAATGEICVLGRCEPPPACTATSCTPPPASCDGLVAVLPVSSACIDDACVDNMRREDCGILNLVCEDGQCVDGDPCAGVVCDSPPPGLCSGSLLVPYLPDGLCGQGRCRYAFGTPTDCATSGLTCRDGACVDPNSCTTACDTPPAPVCSGDTVVTSRLPGTCAGGTCLYEQALDNCATRGLTCADGACADPCAGVACPVTGEATCDAQTAVARTNGRCIGDACQYDETRTDCLALGQSCFEGACVEDCGGACTTPPAPFCVGNNAVSYAPTGTCEPGGCVYTPSTISCPALGQGCRDGACVDLCAGVTCAAPPTPFCETATLAVRFPNPGTCIDGACDYARQVTECAATGRECRGGSCVDPCVGVTCPDPDPRCEGDTRVVSSGGACTDGRCQFTENRTDCRTLGRVCTGGACTDPCDDVTCTPPAPFCDASVAVTTANDGCSLGVCQFTETYRACADEDAYCQNGDCVPGDPCTGVDCSIEAFCEGDIRVSYPTAPVCEVGSCFVDDSLSVRVDCFADAGLSCVGGACVSFPSPTVGDLVVSELAPIGAGALAGVAWFEITNRSNRRVALNNAVIRDAGNRTRTLLAGGSSLGPGQSRSYAITTNPGVLAGTALADAVVWTPAQLSVGTSGTLTILEGATVLSAVTWDATWPFAAGRAAQLSLLAREDQLGSVTSWCRTWATIDANNQGTPGRPNNDCTILAAENVSQGLIFVDEFVARTDDGSPSTSWFVEVRNDRNQPVGLDGLRLSIGTETALVPDGTTIPPFERLLLAGADVTLPAPLARTTVALAHTLSGGAGQVALRPVSVQDPDDPIALLTWGASDGVFTVRGVSWQRDGLHNIDVACLNAGPVADGLRATPLSQNRSCVGTLACSNDGQCGAPGSLCDGPYIVRVPSSGFCGDLGCDYTTSLVVEDCPEDGQVCQAGICAVP